MARHTEVELKTFEVSNRNSNSALSVTSVALISGAPSGSTPDQLCRLIQENQRWLLSPGLCRIQIIVDQSRLSLRSHEAEVGFLSYLADVICQCSLWTALGLTIKLEDIQHPPMYAGGPNLFFIVEHPNKSTVLLSPPHIPTACFDGIECLFRCNPDGPQVTHADDERTTSGESNDDNDVLMMDVDLDQVEKEWEDIGDMAEKALCALVGTKQVFRGSRVVRLENRPSLLDLAPSIWNAHYLKTVSVHEPKFRVISTILAAHAQVRPSSPRQTATGLPNDNASDNSSSDSTATDINLDAHQINIESKLWDLTRITLKPNIHVKNQSRVPTEQPNEPFGELFEHRAQSRDDLGEIENGFINHPDQRLVSQTYGIQNHDCSVDSQYESMEVADESHTLENHAIAQRSTYFPNPSFQSPGQGSLPSSSSLSNTGEVDGTPTI